MLSFFPRGVLDEILTLIESVSEGSFSTLLCLLKRQNSCDILSEHASYPIDEISADDFRKLLDINLVSYFLVAKVRGWF